MSFASLRNRILHQKFQVENEGDNHIDLPAAHSTVLIFTQTNLYSFFFQIYCALVSIDFSKITALFLKIRNENIVEFSRIFKTIKNRETR